MKLLKLLYIFGIVFSPEQEPRKSVRHIKNTVLILVFVTVVTLVGYAAHLISNTGSATLEIGGLIVSAITAVCSTAYCISVARKEL